MIGAGISGLTTAYLLSRRHDVQVFEAGDYVGGHTHTVDLKHGGQDYAVDTGFIVFNDRTYPFFCRLLDELKVKSQPTEMSFSVKCDATSLEYCGSSLNGLFAQRRNLLRPAFLQLVKDFFRFQKRVESFDPHADPRMTVGEFFQRERFGLTFTQKYFLPMGSAIWSCPRGTFENFPIAFIIDFYRNHGLLSIKNRPQWRVITGGSHQYVRSMLDRMTARIRTRAAVQQIRRSEDQVRVLGSNLDETFDQIVFACHSDQALKILAENATLTEKQILQAIPYEDNSAVLHTDETVLPVRRRAWASWNYLIPRSSPDAANVTYNMNILQQLKSDSTFCVTLNSPQALAEDKILGRFQYAHPVFSSSRASVQARHEELIGTNRTSFCGAYWGNGFHEDGVVSALKVCRRLDPAALDGTFGSALL